MLRIRNSTIFSGKATTVNGLGDELAIKVHRGDGISKKSYGGGGVRRGHRLFD